VRGGSLRRRDALPLAGRSKNKERVNQKENVKKATQKKKASKEQNPQKAFP
jgi:hypothetical protein